MSATRSQEEKAVKTMANLDAAVDSAEYQKASCAAELRALSFSSLGLGGLTGVFIWWGLSTSATVGTVFALIVAALLGLTSLIVTGFALRSYAVDYAPAKVAHRQAVVERDRAEVRRLLEDQS